MVAKTLLLQATTPPTTNYVTEPTLHGGRNSVEPTSVDLTPDSTLSTNQILDPGKITSLPTDNSTLQLYAQELAPVQLQLSSSTWRALSSPPVPGVHRSNRPQSYVEPTFHTSFCNDLLCHPRLLHNCPPGHLVVKIELRELEWRDDLNTYHVHLPRSICQIVVGCRCRVHSHIMCASFVLPNVSAFTTRGEVLFWSRVAFLHVRSGQIHPIL